MFNIEKILIGVKNWAESSAPIDHIVFAVNQSKAEMESRIFNSEQGTKDVKGAGLGGYSNSYKKVRESMGRQTANVDLELTGSLRRGISTVKRNSQVAIAIPSATERQKVEWLETKYKKNIFNLSETEKKDAYNLVRELFSDDIKSIVNGVS